MLLISFYILLQAALVSVALLIEPLIILERVLCLDLPSLSIFS